MGPIEIEAYYGLLLMHRPWQKAQDDTNHIYRITHVTPSRVLCSAPLPHLAAAAPWCGHGLSKSTARLSVSRNVCVRQRLSKAAAAKVSSWTVEIAACA
jgi:hypothetical protein